MLRKVILMTGALLLVMTGVASAGPGVATLAAVQDTGAGEEPADTPPVSEFKLGERYSNGLFDLEIQDAFSVESPLYPGYDEVRLSAAFRHNTDVPWLASEYAFTGEYGYPVLQLIDGAGEIHPVPTNVLSLRVEVVDEETETTTEIQLGDYSYQVGGFALSMQPRGIPARWTVGFRVPSAFNHDLKVQASFGGAVLAEWNLDSSPAPAAGWERPEGFELAELGDEIAWGDSLSVEPKAVATEVCGDPRYGHVSVQTTLLIGVSSLSNRDAVWPGVDYPEVAALAVWSDGTAARYKASSLANTEDDPLSSGRYGENVVVPPQTSYDRLMEFMAPKDGRFSNVNDDPIALVLYPPGGPAVWVDLTSPSGSVPEFECEQKPAFQLFLVDRNGPAPQPPLPVLESETIFENET